MKLYQVSYNLISENVEKLLPHLVQECDRYKVSCVSWNNEPTVEILKLLQCDPKFYDDHIVKKKTLANSKAPFAKDMIRFLAATPEKAISAFLSFNNANLIRDMFKAYNNSMRMGGKIDLKNISSFEELEEAVQDYYTGDIVKSEAEQCGFSAVYEDDRYAVFLIDKYIDSSEAPIQEIRDLAAREPENSHVHACMTTTNWCVRHKNTFEGTYKPPTYYLVYTKRGRRYSKSFLIHFNSGQFKDPGDGIALGGPSTNNRPSTKVKEARRFSNAMIENANTNEFAKKYLEKLSHAKGDFAGILSNQDLLEKTIVLTGIVPYGTLTYVKDISREFLEKIIAGTNVSASDMSILITKFADILSDSELNDYRKRYSDKLIENHDNMYSSNADVAMNSLKNWNGYENWIEMLERSISIQPAKPIFRYITKIRKKRWPEVEEVLSQDPKIWDKYTQMFGIDTAFESSNADPAKRAYSMAVAKLNLTGDVDDSDIEPILKNLPLAIDFAVRYYGSWAELEVELKKPENSGFLRQYREGLRHARP